MPEKFLSNGKITHVLTEEILDETGTR